MSSMFGVMSKFADWLDKECPDMVKLCMPRRYINPPDYANPRILAAQMASQWTRFKAEGKEGLYRDDAFMGSLWVADQLIRYDVPTYFVSKELLKAVMAIDPPKDFTLQEINWPFPAMAFVLPISFMKEYTGNLVPFIAYARTPKGLNHLFNSASTPILNDKGDILNMWYVVFHGGIQPVDYVGQFTLDNNMYDVANCQQFKNCSEDHPMRDLLKEAFYDKSEPEPQQDLTLINKLHSIIPNLLLLLTSRPRFIESGTLQRAEKVKQGGKSLDALWNPNFIGRAYRIPVVSETNITGTRLRFHLRRGHYTWQSKGSRNELYPISQMPLLSEGGIDWGTATPEQKEKFLASHERKLIEPILVNI